MGCVFYHVGDWDDLQIDLRVSHYDDFKIQFAGIFPVFLEFNGSNEDGTISYRLTLVFTRDGIVSFPNFPA